jgi:hypothetical protein
MNSMAQTTSKLESAKGKTDASDATYSFSLAKESTSGPLPTGLLERLVVIIRIMVSGNSIIETTPKKGRYCYSFYED